MTPPETSGVASIGNADNLESMEPALSRGWIAEKKEFIILLADIVVMLALLKFLPYEPQTSAGLSILFFVGVLWLTEAVHITITALLVPILAVIFGLMNVNKALVGFADPTIFLFFGGFALATALHIQGIDRFIANSLLRLARGRLATAAIMLFLATAGLSMWISNTATAAMMLPLSLGILGNLDREKEHGTFIFLLLGVAYSASIGGLGTLVGSPPNAIAAAHLGLDFMGWMKFGLPVMIVMLPLMIGVLYLVFRPNLKHHIKVQDYDFIWTQPRVVTIGIFLLAALCWIFSSVLSEALGKVAQFDSVVAIGAAILIGVTGVATWKQIQVNTEWGVLLLFGGGLTLSAILKDSGASVVMAEAISHLIGNGHWLVILLAAAAFIILLTEFTSNTASAALMVPLFGTVGEALGMPSHLLPLVIGIGASMAFMLPVATPPNAIVFGSGYIKQQEMVKAGFCLVVVSILVLALFGWFVWR
ncbi:MAG: DASS family sodium-coupled anion symporter [Zoogloeaceae bacterium]|jgi:sodium-dependent dicarboxylate transporter 2/3/5|nr:DASS family sodium-coupled anion symporter [Zoogloeaceae bacterium]